MTSRTTVLTVVIGLLLFALLALGGACVLIAIDKDVPPQVWSLAGVSVGALGSLLVSTSSTLGKNDREATGVPTTVVATGRPSVTTPAVAPSDMDAPRPGPTPQGA